jgi:hypothetical protein
MTTLPHPHFQIGVVGHRPDRLKAPDAVSADIAMLLDMAAVAAADRFCVMLVTSLAEGADRIAAHQALVRRMQLRTVLPFERGDYEKDFPQSITEFSALMGAAIQALELPGQRRDAPAAYAAAAGVILAEANLLIVVWDGGPSAGPGGTADTIARAHRHGTPMIRVDANGQKPPASIPAGDDLRLLFAQTLPRL